MEAAEKAVAASSKADALGDPAPKVARLGDPAAVNSWWRGVGVFFFVSLSCSLSLSLLLYILLGYISVLIIIFTSLCDSVHLIVVFQPCHRALSKYYDLAIRGLIPI
jgi:hypothetical protein